MINANFTIFNSLKSELIVTPSQTHCLTKQDTYYETFYFNLSSTTLYKILALYWHVLVYRPFFLLTGFSKIEFFDATAQYMSSVGLPEFLLPFVIAFEIVGGLFILLGFLTQLTAVAFCWFQPS